MSFSRPRGLERRLNTAVRTALLSLLLGASAGVYAASPQSQDYHLAAGPLGRTLSHFASQTGLALSFDPALTEGLNSPALVGHYSQQEALQRLLAGSGLEIVAKSDGHFSLRKIRLAKGADVTLLPVTVIGAAGQGSRTEGTSSYTTHAMQTATRLSLPIRDTPQSVSVITRERMDDMGIKRIDEALEQTTGVMVGQLDTERTSFSARGFSIQNIQIDGMPRGSKAPLSDTVLYDRVEVVRGATGLLGGTGDPSAAVNMIRKRPTREFQANAELAVGGWNRRRTELDLSVPLMSDGRIRARTALAYEESDASIDMYHEKNKVGMLILEADITPALLLTLGADFQHNNPTGVTWGAVPYWNADGSLANLPRNFSLSTPWNTWNTEQETLFTSLQYQFEHGWKVYLGYGHTKSRTNQAVAYGGGGYPDPKTGKGMFLWTLVAGENEYLNENIDFNLTGPFQLLGRQHTLILGWNGGKESNRSIGGSSNESYSEDIADYRSWSGNIPQPVFTPDGSFSDREATLGGAYIAGRFNLLESLNVIVGARLSNYRSETRNHDEGGRYVNTTSKQTVDNEMTPYLGVVYEINPHFSTYASYTSLFKPQSKRDKTGKSLQPETGTSSELGIKGEFFDGLLNASFSVFHSKKQNLAEEDKTVSNGRKYHMPGDPQGTTEQPYVADADGITVKGLEFDTSGQITPTWNLNAGYTYVQAKTAQGERAVTNQPQHLMRLSSAYRFDGALQGLKLGGSALAQSRIYSESWSGRPPLNDASLKEQIFQDAYALFNVMASYQINKNLSAQLNINNLFDKEYYRNVGFYDGVFWGESRNMTLSLRGTY